MKRITLIVGFLFLLGGCAGGLTHLTKNEQDFERDKYECQMIAEQSAANWGSRGNIFMIAQEINRCMRLKFGWTPVSK